MNHRFEDQVVVITGASAGVGRAAARAFAQRGAKVALLARFSERLEDAREEAEAWGRPALAIDVDVADAAAVETAAEGVEARLGPIDVWVNCAMTTVFGPADEITPAEFERVTQVTYLGSVYGTQAALKRMRERNQGTIVQVGSALAHRAIPLQSAYCGAKHGARGFTDAVRCELIHDGLNVHITSVELPALNTPQFDWCRNRMQEHAQPVAPVYEPEVAAEAILRAAAEHPRELWVGGSTWKTILGNRLAPGLADRLAARMAWEGQLMEDEKDDRARDNLLTPVDKNVATRGRFSAHARKRTWMPSNPARVAAALCGAVALAFGFGLSRGLR